jgi:hypothetical protein
MNGINWKTKDDPDKTCSCCGKPFEEGKVPYKIIRTIREGDERVGVFHVECAVRLGFLPPCFIELWELI